MNAQRLEVSPFSWLLQQEREALEVNMIHTLFYEMKKPFL